MANVIAQTSTELIGELFSLPAFGALLVLGAIAAIVVVAGYLAQK